MRFCIQIITALLLTALAFWRTEFFSLQKIQVPLLQESDSYGEKDFEWPLTFRYLGRGRQCFAFESFDQQYVLKFFDRAQLSLSWQRFLSPSNYKKELKRFTNRIQIYPESYRIALEKMADETGLLVVHQGVSVHKYPTVEIVDKASRQFLVDLNQVPFILQKKGNGKLLDRLPQQFEEKIDQFLAFHSKRIRLFITDGDKDIKRNYAWNEDALLYIDPARFALKKNIQEPLHFKREWWGATYRLRKWISLNMPEKLEYFDRRVEECRQETRL